MATLLSAGALVAAAVGCALVAGIDDVHLVDDAGGDTATTGDAELDVTRDDGVHDSTIDAPPIDASGDAIDATGDAPADVDARDGADAGPTCPTGKGVMALITAPGGKYCIDTHEVTNDQFNVYLADITLPFDSHPACGKWKASSRPTPDNTPGEGNRPVSDVNYCYAWAYCKWAGKRLCGHIGGGHASSSGGDPENEWFYACANGLKQTIYPYGNTYVGATCNTDQADPFSTSMLLDVGAKTSCHGIDPGFDQLFDMSGNVAEFDDWADSYLSTALDTTSVHTHGGAATWKTDATCGKNDAFGIDTPFPDVGFRCCADPL